MLGFGLRQLRDEKSVKQAYVANVCDVSASAVSRWENTGDLPPDKVDPVLQALEATIAELRLAVIRALRGHDVDSVEMLDAWRDAVSFSELPMPAKIVLFQMSSQRFRRESRSRGASATMLFVEASKEELATQRRLKDLDAAWDAAVTSEFVEPIGTSGAFKLRFPED